MVTKLERRGEEYENVEVEILAAAKQWARLTTLGYELDGKGERVMYSPTDARELAGHYTTIIQRASIRMLRIDTSGT
jgi:hypothetical protein